MRGERGRGRPGARSARRRARRPRRRRCARSPAATRWPPHPEAEEAARRLLAQPRTPPLTQAQAETLAIVAYLQPVSRPEIARIRGVASESALQTLTERGLIEESGRSRFGAVIYRTTPLFERLFGLAGLDALPDPARFDPTPEDEAELRERLLRGRRAARRVDASFANAPRQVPRPLGRRLAPRAEELVAAGRVRVGGEVVRDPARDVEFESGVEVDRRPVGPEPREVWMLNKPAGVTSTAREPGRRRAVTELIDSKRRLYPVGRLDADSTGLILITNDGELANRLTHPRYEVPRTYRARLRRPPTDAELRRLRDGVELDDGPTAPREGAARSRRGWSRSRSARAATARCGGWPRRSATRSSTLERIAFGPAAARRAGARRVAAAARRRAAAALEGSRR